MVNKMLLLFGCIVWSEKISKIYFHSIDTIIMFCQPIGHLGFHLMVAITIYSGDGKCVYKISSNPLHHAQLEVSQHTIPASHTILVSSTGTRTDFQDYSHPAGYLQGALGQTHQHQQADPQLNPTHSVKVKSAPWFRSIPKCNKFFFGLCYTFHQV